MTDRGADERRRAAAHLVVDDLDAPSLDDATSHHLGRVVRLRRGDRVTLTDGAGRWRPASWQTGMLRVEGDVERVPGRGAPVTIGFAIPKRDRPEWIVQKLTELGVGTVMLLHAERSVVRWDGIRAERHVAKLRTVAREALRQSRGVWLPEIVGPLDAGQVLGGAAVAEPGGAVATGHRTVLIGPEGGWTAAELDRAAARIGLGDTVLRVETAAIVAAAQMVRAR